MPGPPIVDKPEAEVNDPLERAILIRRLKGFRTRALQGESERRAQTRRGAKLAKNRHWEDGITQGRTPITANQTLAFAERFIADLIKYKPTPEIQAINGAEDDAAALIEGGILTNIEHDKLLAKIKIGLRGSFFSASPWAAYTSWDPTLRKGIGDFTTRLIKSHQLIVDAKAYHFNDMEFCGFREEDTSRAKLAMLFPAKAREIEMAAYSSGDTTPGMPTDPWKSSTAKGGSGSVSRLVADDQGDFVGKSTVKVGGTKRNGTENPMAEKVDVEYLWIDDPTPIEVTRPALDSRGRPKMRHARHPDTTELLFSLEGWDTVQDPRTGSPLYQPRLKPRMEPVHETVIDKKYPFRRHIAWIPADGIILWDVKWDGPIPLWTLATAYPIDEFHREGQGLRLISLQIARNILYTIIFQRLKLSLGGTWLATHASGFKRNRLTPEDGQVFYAKKIDQESIKQFPVQPIDVAYVGLLHEIEAEMMKIIGLSPVQRGQQAGRVDSADGYDKLIEQAGSAVHDAGQLVEEGLRDFALIAMYYMQTYYTHEHFVEVEAGDGQTTWRQASRFAVAGEFACRIETGSTQAHSETAMRAVATEGAQLGIYPLPMLAQLGHFPRWRRALKMKMALAADPTKAPLVGPAGAPPGKTATHHKSPTSRRATA